MATPGDLLDELARVYARAAVDRFLRYGVDVATDAPGDNAVDQLSDAAPQVVSSTGAEGNPR